MSDEPTRDETPAPASPPLPPEASSPLPVEAKPATGQTPAGQQAGTVRPPIDYAMPAQKKSWLPTPERVRQIGCLFKLLFGFTVLLLMGYFALMALNPKARQWALQGTKPGPGGTAPSGKGPTPFKAVNQILAIPAQALGKTDDVVKANNARVGQLDGVIKEEEDKTKGGSGGRNRRPVVDPFGPAAPADPKNAARAAGAAEVADSGPQSVSGSHLLALAEKQAATSPSSEPPAPSPSPSAPSSQLRAPSSMPDTPNEMKLPGDIVISQASPAGTPRASAAFFYWVVKLNISGITQGKPARALINNRLTYEGDEVNRTLGVVFAQLDAANKLLVFRDQTGATVTRSY